MFSKEAAQALVDLRTRHDKEQGVFADLVGIHPTIYNELENGKRKITKTYLQRIKDARLNLGVSKKEIYILYWQVTIAYALETAGEDSIKTEQILRRIIDLFTSEF